MATPRALVLLAALMASAAQSAPFWLAADFSYEPIESKFGTSSPYRLTAGGPTLDAFVLLKQTGVNIIRLRLWVNPTTGFEGDESYCNLTSVLSVAKRVTAAGLAVWLDFHASDTWADPGKQAKPRAWANLAADALLAAWVDHVTTAVNALVAQGSAPAVVQGAVAVVERPFRPLICEAPAVAAASLLFSLDYHARFASYTLACVAMRCSTNTCSWQ